ncbi:MAG: hypothetical protein OK452_10660 [Thaumarchaeota archaeon]|nr:hypothetical protein [Nitrososphaerota archaeon]
MFGFLSPRRVAARKLARMIAQKQTAGSVSDLVEPKASRAETTSRALPLDPLEIIFDQELRKYGISLG